MVSALEWMQKDAFFSRLRDGLDARPASRLSLAGYKPAAVMLLLWRQNGVPHILLIRRSHRVRYHKGEISFPGGRWEPADEELWTTAQRESHEEVGVDPRNLSLLGRLDDAFSLSRFSIAPFVAALRSSFPFKPNQEVAELVPLPLHRFLRPDRLSVRFQLMDGITAPIYTYAIDNRIVWGATARILKGFIELLKMDPVLLGEISPPPKTR